MILQALMKQYENLAQQGKVSREGWSQGKVSYGIRLSKEGKIQGIVWLKQEEERGKKKVWMPTIMSVPEMVTRSSGVSAETANFLCDNSKYLLGISSEKKDNKMERKVVLNYFQAARERHLSLLKHVDGAMAQAIRLYFEHWNPERAAEIDDINEKWEEITDGGNLIFLLDMEYAQEDPAIKEAWEQNRNSAKGEVEGICLVTGKRTQISRIHKTIKGVPGAQSSGAALVSFNAPAFESYGKEQSYNAPVGKYAEFAYTTALNYMLSQRDDTFLLGDSMIVFWAENGKEEYPKTFSMAMDVKPDNQEIIRGIFANLKAHRPIALDDIQLDTKQNFSILSLAPNAARLSVRFFYQNSFGMILQNISQHYQRMELVKPVWEDRDYLGISQLLAETMNQKSKDKMPVPNMASMVLMAILSGSRYPASLYTDTLIRIRTEQGKVTWGRAAIIKAYLIQNYKWEKGEQYMALNESTKETAYVLGRLFAVLESIQTDASPGVKATIRDRYFNSACATPESVFPVLLKLKNTHIRKIEREKEGLKVHYEIMLAEIMGKLEQFPKRLSLEEQGKFILGYYHQMQKRYEKKEEN